MMKTYLYAQNLVTDATLKELLATGAAYTVGAPTTAPLLPVTVDEKEKPDLDDVLANMGYAYVGEAVPGDVPTGRKDFGVGKEDPADAEIGNTYYNLISQQERTFDGIAWLEEDEYAFTAGKDLLDGQPVALEDNGGTPAVFLADLVGRDPIGIVRGDVAAGSKVPVRLNGVTSVPDGRWDAIPDPVDVGKKVYLDGNSMLSLTASTWQMGRLSQGGAGQIQILVGIVEG